LRLIFNMYLISLSHGPIVKKNFNWRLFKTTYLEKLALALK